MPGLSRFFLSVAPDSRRVCGPAMHPVRIALQPEQERCDSGPASVDPRAARDRPGWPGVEQGRNQL